MSGQPIAYRLQPVYAAGPGTIQTAALMTCMATGEVLDGMGGGGDFLSPKVVELLRGGDCTITKGATPAAEMLAALEAALPIIASDYEAGAEQFQPVAPDKALAMIRAAIAKARGEQS